MAKNEVNIKIVATDKATSTIKNIEKQTTVSTKKMKTDWVGLASKVYLAQRAFIAISRTIGFFVNAAGKQAKVINQLNAVLESTGHIVGITSEEVQEMAKSFQDVTAFGDEAVLMGQSLLLTFTNIGRDIFPQATETMLDMSVALGQDLKSSAIQLGKALNDPILGMTALRRVGVNFNADQVKLVKNLVASGKEMEAQKFILDELATEFGGSAKAEVEDFTGKIDQLKNSFGDFAEEIGKFVTKSDSSNENGSENV